MVWRFTLLATVNCDLFSPKVDWIAASCSAVDGNFVLHACSLDDVPVMFSQTFSGQLSLIHSRVSS
jgi:hypothetical protein